MPQRIALLGSTGSIGTQSLDIISRYPDEFIVESLVAGNNVDLLTRQALKFRPEKVVIGNEGGYRKLKENLAGTGIEVYGGPEASAMVVSSGNADVVIASVVGYSGLRPVMAAIKAGKKIALANKETLVVAGALIEKLIAQTGSTIIPVDSEHSAIFQCLAGEEGNPVEKITLTASGGPFFGWSREALENVTPRQALKHPNWDMGNKVTIDSASLMNKGLEVMEAKWLFNLHPDQIDVVVHPQSIIHSFVHFADGSVKAQLGIPDMRVPILYALTYPRRFVSDLPRLDFSRYPSLTFAKPDTGSFRNLNLAFSALRQGGNMPCIMNAANEVAVCSFLGEQIGFLEMSDVVEFTMENTRFIIEPELEDLEISDQDARRVASDFISKLQKQI